MSEGMRRSNFCISLARARWRVRFECEVFYNVGRRYLAMLCDAFLPATFPHSREPVFRAVERPGIRYSAARWTPEALGKVVAALREGEAALRAISDDDLLAAWGDTVSTFLLTVSLVRRALVPPLARR